MIKQPERLRFATVEAFLRGNSATYRPAKTTAFDVTVRRLANGSDYTMRLFARDEVEAGNRALERVRFNIGMRRAKLAELNAKGIAVFRIVSCEVSPDQSRPVG